MNEKEIPPLKDRIKKLLTEALSGTSPRSKNTILREALKLAEEIK